MDEPDGDPGRCTASGRPRFPQRYMMKPEVSRESSNYVYYASTRPRRNSSMRACGNPAVYPPDDVMAKLFVNTPLDSRMQRLSPAHGPRW